MQIANSRSVDLSSVGVGTGQIVGDNNTQNIMVGFGGREGLTHSVVHDLLALVYNGPLCAESELSLDTPISMNEKLRFNNASKYMNVIRNHSGDYTMVRDAIKEHLVDALLHDMDYDAHTHSMEDVESFCIALVACGVSRCIVLVKPEREEG